MELARKFLTAHEEDIKLLSLVQRLKESNLDAVDRKNSIYNFMKERYPQSLSADLMEELTKWTFS